MTKIVAIPGYVFVEDGKVYVIAYPGSEPEFSRSVPAGVSDAAYAQTITLADATDDDDQVLALVYPTDPPVRAASLLNIEALVDASNEAIRLLDTEHPPL